MSKAISGAVQIDLANGDRIWWCPPHRPYWVHGSKCPRDSCGPSLTDEEIALYCKARPVVDLSDDPN
jgi:hypothetical protein